MTIAYALTSVFADGEAEYSWKRAGDRYEISGTAEASGFFTLFLEGRITQESSGTVTPDGLRPDRFVERRGDLPEEGLSFDWGARTVEFRRGPNTRTGALTDTTVALTTAAQDGKGTLSQAIAANDSCTALKS